MIMFSLINSFRVGGRSGGFQTPGSCVKQKGDIDATVHMFETWEREASIKNKK